MYLRRKGNSNLLSSSEVSFEKIGEKFVLININNNYNHKDILSDSPYYWRLVTEDNNPPLEISLNIETGQIQEITFFISEENFRHQVEFSCNVFLEKTIFHTDLFKRYNYYNDFKGEYSVFLRNNSLCCYFNNEKPISIINQNKHISYFLNNQKYLVGFSINNLNNSYLNVLSDSKLI